MISNKSSFKFIQTAFILIFFVADYLNAQVVITDITSTNLIGDAYNNGLYGGHGVMFADVHGDGDPDMYITMNNFSPMADQFFENIGSGVFVEKAAERAIENFDMQGSHGWVWADLDNDGDYDGWNGSYNKNIPYRNRNNQLGFFDDYFSQSGIQNLNYGTRGVAAFDFDKDGDLDLFANNWYTGGVLEENEFYRNDGNFTFTRIDNGLTFAKGDQGVCDGDFDNDGDVDLILGVFDDPQRCVEIWENVNGQFYRVQNTGLNLCGTIDGVTFWDINNDGWLDVLSGEKIYLNNGDKTFTELLNVPEGTRFMRGIADLNNDGYWDLISPGLNKVFINNGNLTFTQVSYSTGSIADPRTVSFADIDGDGDVDFALGQKEAYNRLYRNDYNGGNKYLFINLKSNNDQIGAFGTKIYLYSETGDTLLSYRQANSNHGYLAQDDPVLHFGCGSRERVKVKAVFLNGNTYEFVTNTNRTKNVFDIHPLLLPPTNLFAYIAPLETQSVKLKWTDNSINELGFVIERKHGDITSNSEFFIIDTVGSETTMFTDYNLNDSTTYTYRIHAFNAVSASLYSNLAQVNTPVPVELTSFSGTNQNGIVMLEWETATEINSVGFDIERRTENKSWIKIGFVQGSGSSSSPKKYLFRDQNAVGGKVFQYRLKQLDADGSFKYYYGVEVEILPDKFELLQNFPNPFNPSTTFKFGLKENAKVKISLLNLIGEEIITLLDEEKEAGYHSFELNAGNLASGVYLCKLDAKSAAQSFTQVRKIVLMK